MERASRFKRRENILAKYRLDEVLKLLPLLRRAGEP